MNRQVISHKTTQEVENRKTVTSSNFIVGRQFVG